MPTSLTARKRIRKNFGRIPEVTMMPNLIEVQRQSYEFFLQMHVRPNERGLYGLHESFKQIFRSRTSRTGRHWTSFSTSWRSRSTTSKSASSAA
jgi:DNA-directed RNA polymerase beta subunit